MSEVPGLSYKIELYLCECQNVCVCVSALDVFHVVETKFKDFNT